MSEGEGLQKKQQHPSQHPFHPQFGTDPMANMAWQYPPSNMHNMFPSYAGYVMLYYRRINYEHIHLRISHFVHNHNRFSLFQ